MIKLSFLSNWAKILLFVCMLLILCTLFKVSRTNKQQEGFEQESEFRLTEGYDIYDGFYANIYDHLVYNQAKNNYEIGQIMTETKPTTESIILDVGSGTGHHVNMFGSQGMNITGIDISSSMVKKAKENYPKYNFIQGDILDSSQFNDSTFTHIFCLYFTLYYFPDKAVFFQNAMKWLKPGGYLVIHAVDREQFDPILPPGNPLLLVSPQRYAKERITKTSIVFNDMDYAANFNLDQSKNIATFDEKFTNRNSGKVRKNQHKFYMEPTRDIMTKAQNAGFIYQAEIDLIKAGYEYQSLLVFVKPN